MNGEYEYLVGRIRVLEEHRRLLMQELRNVTGGVYTPLVSEENGEQVFMLHECTKCGLKTVIKRKVGD